MTWELAGQLGGAVYVAGVLLLSMRVEIPMPPKWSWDFGCALAIVLWPVLLLNRTLGIGGKI